jgi:acetamidase/formamidase
MLLLIDLAESPFMTDHKRTIHKHHVHHCWNNAFPSRLTIAPGESIRFETADASGGQLTPASTVADVAKLDFALAGPPTSRASGCPFTGTIGVAPRRRARHSIVPPRQVGGNMDVRDIAEGTELWLPVEVEGAMSMARATRSPQASAPT